MNTILPIKVLFIEDDGCHLLVKAKINGKAASLLIDTGASKTVFDKNRIHHFVKDKEFRAMDKLSTGLGTSDMQTHAIMIQKLKLGKFVINDFEAVLLDLAHVNSSYQSMELPVIDGVLGSDLMMTFNAVIDYKARKLKLQSANK